MSERHPDSYDNLYNKTRHSYIYIAYSRPNGWTDWAKFFCVDTHGWPGEGVLYAKKIQIFFQKIFFRGQRLALQRVKYIYPVKVC